jgi:biopolymer transport protein ExbD
MKRIFLLLVFLSLSIIFILVTAFSEESKNLQFKKQPEIQQVKPKKPVRIKLKRSSDDKYTWEIAGDDADEIVRADRKLRRLLKIE